MKEPVIYRFREPKPTGTPPLLKEELYRTAAHDFSWIRLDPGLTKQPEVNAEADSFIFVAEGELRVTVNGESWDLGPGDLIMVPQRASRGFAAGPTGAAFMAAHLRVE